MSMYLIIISQSASMNNNVISGHNYPVHIRGKSRLHTLVLKGRVMLVLKFVSINLYLGSPR